MTDVTRLLSAIEQADPSAAEALLPLLHRRQASIQPIGENEMPIVSVGKGSITGQTQVGGTTWYEWTFPVVVDGQAGVYSLMDQSNDPADEPALENTVNTILQQDPGAMGGIADNGGDTGDDDGDGTVAGNDGGDAGDSV
jgi:hypothetical protein